MAGVEDNVASVVSLARVMLTGLNKAQENTAVRTATLALILETFIDHSTTNQGMRVMESSGKEIGSLIAAFTNMKGEHAGNK